MDLLQFIIQLQEASQQGLPYHLGRLASACYRSTYTKKLAMKVAILAFGMTACLLGPAAAATSLQHATSAKSDTIARIRALKNRTPHEIDTMIKVVEAAYKEGN